MSGGNDELRRELRALMATAPADVELSVLRVVCGNAGHRFEGRLVVTGDRIARVAGRCQLCGLGALWDH